jgi:hypothetical protein
MSALWSEYELQCLYELVNEVDWINTAKILLPGRTRTAINVKMSALRKEAGIVPMRVGPKSKWMPRVEYDRAKSSSDKLLNALLEMAA